MSDNGLWNVSGTTDEGGDWFGSVDDRSGLAVVYQGDEEVGVFDTTWIEKEDVAEQVDGWLRGAK